MESISSLVDLALTLGYALVSLCLTAIGIDAEYLGLARVGAGEPMIGVWFVFMGVVALAAAALVARDRLLPRVRPAG